MFSNVEQWYSLALVVSSSLWNFKRYWLKLIAICWSNWILWNLQFQTVNLVNFLHRWKMDWGELELDWELHCVFVSPISKKLGNRFCNARKSYFGLRMSLLFCISWNWTVLISFIQFCLFRVELSSQIILCPMRFWFEELLQQEVYTQGRGEFALLNRRRSVGAWGLEGDFFFGWRLEGKRSGREGAVQLLMMQLLVVVLR